MQYDSDYLIRLATLAALGGDTTKKFDSVYSIDLEILALAAGGGGSDSEIDDDHVSTGTTYSSSKIVDLLSGVGFEVSVVESLPASGNSRTIYLAPKQDTETNDVYDEYLYVSNAWEKIGTTQVDLSNYVSSTTVSSIWTGSQADYDLISPKLSNTVYLITE